MRIFFLTTIGLLFSAICQAGDDQYVHEYFAKLEGAKKAVFYTECRLRTEKDGKASLVFPIGEVHGLYIEKVGKKVVNSADVSIENGEWHMEDALGGVYTITRVSYLISELLTDPFELVMPKNMKGILNSKPKKQCVEKLPE